MNRQQRVYPELPLKEGNVGRTQKTWGPTNPTMVIGYCLLLLAIKYPVAEVKVFPKLPRQANTDVAQIKATICTCAGDPSKEGYQVWPLYSSHARD